MKWISTDDSTVALAGHDNVEFYWMQMLGVDTLYWGPDLGVS